MEEREELERPLLPLGHVLEHPVDEPADVSRLTLVVLPPNSARRVGPIPRSSYSPVMI
jgi:hypothetical protein